MPDQLSSWLAHDLLHCQHCLMIKTEYIHSCFQGHYRHATIAGVILSQTSYAIGRPISWLLAQILSRRDAELGSALRTTAVTTEIELFPPGKNVIPSLGKAVISYRLSPCESLLYSAAHRYRLVSLACISTAFESDVCIGLC